MQDIDVYRQGVMVKPYERLNQEQIERLNAASLKILEETGVWCFNERAAKLFGGHGAKVWEEKEGTVTVWRITFPPGLITEAVAKAPTKFVLGARKPENRLLLDAETPRVYFGSGSETNVWIETEIEEFVSVKDGNFKIRAPRYRELRGNTELLGRAAHIGNQLSNLDFFIRPVNIQDEGITEDNHDVNKFFASLNNIEKHVQAGLTKLEQLPNVLRMGEIIVGGAGALRKNPLISFIACLFKSPLQIVNDTADKVFAIVEAGMPVVISSSPQGGSSAPIQEAGMIAQINAEIIAGVAMTQLIKEGAPVLYGSVPVRARMDDLHDLYGCPEFNQYNIDCAQLARYYKVPCYSSAGVGDAKVPGVQATFEKLFTLLHMAMSGPQYIHYAFGLLDRTNSFCPLQAVLDNEMIDKIKHCMKEPKVSQSDIDDVLKMISRVMGSGHRLYARHARKAIQAGDVSEPFKFESKDMYDRTIERALESLREIEAIPPSLLDDSKISEIFAEVPGILPKLKKTA